MCFQVLILLLHVRIFWCIYAFNRWSLLIVVICWSGTLVSTLVSTFPQNLVGTIKGILQIKYYDVHKSMIITPSSPLIVN